LSFALAKAVPTIFDHTHQSTRNYKNTPDQPLESAAVTRKKKKQGVEKACQKGRFVSTSRRSSCQVQQVATHRLDLATSVLNFCIVTTREIKGRIQI
jgi:hypothetical protein